MQALWFLLLYFMGQHQREWILVEDAHLIKIGSIPKPVKINKRRLI